MSTRLKLSVSVAVTFIVLFCPLRNLANNLQSRPLATQSKTTSKTRLIDFPTQGLGEYFLSQNKRTFMEIWPEKIKTQRAQGPVTVPKDVEVTLATGWGNGASLALLPKLKPNDIQTLNLEGSVVTPDSLKYVFALKGLRKLSLAGTNIDDKDMVALQIALPQLRELDVSYTQISDRCILSIRKMTSLTTLILMKDKITDDGVKRLDGAFLKYLDLSETAISDDALITLAKMQQLSTLNLAKTKITDRGLASLQNAHALKSIDFSGTAISDAGLRDLGKMSAIEELNLSQTKVTDQGLIHLGKPNNLRKLWLRDLTKVTDASIPVLTKHNELTDLEIQKTLITPGGVLTLANALPHSEIHSKSPCKCRKHTRVN